MKKSLVALAVLAASGASFAQSSVTLYGIADAYFGSVKNENGVTGTSLTQTVLDSGGLSGSRWGMKGSEDLGGGLKANFVLEQGFALDTGAGTAGQAFSRYSYVGFSGGFGEVKLGKTGTAYDDVNGTSNGALDSAFSPSGSVFVNNAYSWNPANTIIYTTPSMGGFGAEVSYSLGENKTATTSASAITAFNVTYGAGPVAVQLGYQKEDKSTTSNDTTFTRLGGSYDLGVAKLMANYGKQTNVANVSGSDTTDYQIGVDFPVSSALTLSASFAKSDDSHVGFEQSRKGYGIAAMYTLSKRTTVYGGLEADTATNSAAADSKHSLFAVGVRHTF